MPDSLFLLAGQDETKGIGRVCKYSSIVCKTCGICFLCKIWHTTNLCPIAVSNLSKFSLNSSPLQPSKSRLVWLTYVQLLFYIWTLLRFTFQIFDLPVHPKNDCWNASSLHLQSCLHNQGDAGRWTPLDRTVRVKTLWRTWRSGFSNIKLTILQQPSRHRLPSVQIHSRICKNRLLVRWLVTGVDDVILVEGQALYYFNSRLYTTNLVTPPAAQKMQFFFKLHTQGWSPRNGASTPYPARSVPNQLGENLLDDANFHGLDVVIATDAQDILVKKVAVDVQTQLLPQCPVLCLLFITSLIGRCFLLLWRELPHIRQVLLGQFVLDGCLDQCSENLINCLTHLLHTATGVKDNLFETFLCRVNLDGLRLVVCDGAGASPEPDGAGSPWTNDDCFRQLFGFFWDNCWITLFTWYGRIKEDGANHNQPLGLASLLEQKNPQHWSNKARDFNLAFSKSSSWDCLTTSDASHHHSVSHLGGRTLKKMVSLLPNPWRCGDDGFTQPLNYLNECPLQNIKAKWLIKRSVLSVRSDNH